MEASPQQTDPSTECLSTKLMLDMVTNMPESTDPELADEVLICEYNQDRKTCGVAMMRQREPGVDSRPAALSFGVGETAICLTVLRALQAQDTGFKGSVSGPEEPAVD